MEDGSSSRPQSGRSLTSRQSTRPSSAVSVSSTFSNDSITSQYEAGSKKNFSLPWFCTYLAWFLCLASIFVSAFFIWAYGVSLGNDKTYRWLTSFFVTLVSSFFVVEPIKIIFLALSPWCYRNFILYLSLKLYMQYLYEIHVVRGVHWKYYQNILSS